MSDVITPDRLLHTPLEAAAMLGVGRNRIFDLISSGELVSVKVGRSRRISRRAIVAYVDRLEQTQKKIA